MMAFVRVSYFQHMQLATLFVAHLLLRQHVLITFGDYDLKAGMPGLLSMSTRVILN